MKTLKVSKLTISVLIAANLLSISMASAGANKTTLKKFHQVLKTDVKEKLQDPYYQIKSVKVRELTDEESMEFIDEDRLDDVSSPLTTKDFAPGKHLPPPGIAAPADGGLSVGQGPGTTPAQLPGPIAAPEVPQAGGSVNSVIMVIDQLIAIGQKIIPMIKDGKSVVTNNPMTAVSILPRTDLKDFVVHDMGNWTIPVNKRYKIIFTNGFNVEVVSFVYSVTYQYNGTFNGKGKYLAGIRASARNIDITWGFDLDASSQLIQISNVGTVDNVIAGATIEMSYTVKTVLRNITTSESFHVTGDGRLYKLD